MSFIKIQKEDVEQADYYFDYYGSNETTLINTHHVVSISLGPYTESFSDCKGKVVPPSQYVAVDLTNGTQTFGFRGKECRKRALHFMETVAQYIEVDDSFYLDVNE